MADKTATSPTVDGQSDTLDGQRAEYQARMTRGEAALTADQQERLNAGRAKIQAGIEKLAGKGTVFHDPDDDPDEWDDEDADLDDEDEDEPTPAPAKTTTKTDAPGATAEPKVDGQPAKPAPQGLPANQAELDALVQQRLQQAIYQAQAERQQAEFEQALEQADPVAFKQYIMGERQRMAVFGTAEKAARANLTDALVKGVANGIEELRVIPADKVAALHPETWGENTPGMIAKWIDYVADARAEKLAEAKVKEKMVAFTTSESARLGKSYPKTVTFPESSPEPGKGSRNPNASSTEKIAHALETMQFGRRRR